MAFFFNVPPAISRRDNVTQICPLCGLFEAFESFSHADKNADNNADKDADKHAENLIKGFYKILNDEDE